MESNEDDAISNGQVNIYQKKASVNKNQGQPSTKGMQCLHTQFHTNICSETGTRHQTAYAHREGRTFCPGTSFPALCLLFGWVHILVALTLPCLNKRCASTTVKGINVGDRGKFQHLFFSLGAYSFEETHLEKSISSFFAAGSVCVRSHLTSDIGLQNAKRYRGQKEVNSD